MPDNPSTAEHRLYLRSGPLGWFARDYDFVLTVVTIALSSLIGLLCIGGTVYTFFAAGVDTAWTETSMYTAYLDAMNAILFPLLVALLVVLGLCIPRRLLKRRFLVVASLSMVAGSLVLLAVAGSRGAWLFLLASAASVQLVVIVLTASRNVNVTYVMDGLLVRMGSAVLHLGLIVLVGAFVLGLSGSSQLAVFWVATALVMVGMTVAFYNRELGRLLRRGNGEETPRDS